VTYRVDVTRKARRQMRDLTRTTRRRIDAKLIEFESDPYRGASKLVATSGLRVRVGDYRILYEVDDKEKLVRVDQILHRREAYR